MLVNFPGVESLGPAPKFVKRKEGKLKHQKSKIYCVFEVVYPVAVVIAKFS